MNPNQLSERIFLYIQGARIERCDNIVIDEVTQKIQKNTLALKGKLKIEQFLR